MQCHKCAGDMETKSHGENINLERCRVCYGLLVENHVLDRMRGKWMVETFLDIGAVSIGKKFDRVDDIQCPHCKVDMDKIVDPAQTHIWLESCPNCYRVFLDAGEFSDLKYETFGDKIKDLLKGKRKQVTATE